MSVKQEVVGAVIKRTIFDGVIFGFIFFSLVFAYQYLQGGLDFDAILVQLGSWTQTYAIFSVVGCGMSLALNATKLTTLGNVIFMPPHLRHHSHLPQAWYKSVWKLQSLVATLLMCVLGYEITGVSIIKLLEKESFEHAMRLFTELASPDWSILPKAILKIIESVFIAFMATIISLPISFVLSFLCAKNVMGRTKLGYTIYATLRILFNIKRSVEPILWAIIFSIWVGFGAYAGMLALMIHSIASLAKQYSEMVESIEDGPVEGIESTGASYLQTIWFAIVPQIVLPYISITIFRWDINVRMATIIGFVGGGGIGTLLLEYQGQARWPQVGTIIFVIAVVVWLMDSFSAYVREAIK